MKMINSSLCLLFTSQVLPAAFTYNNLYTDASGNFGDPTTGWSGPASQVVANAGKPTGVQAVVVDELLLNDATSGTLSLGETNAFVGQNGLNTGVMGTMTITVNGGGTFDLNVDAIWANNAGLKFGPNNFGIIDLTNVSSLTVDFRYSEPIAADVNNPPSNNSPFLGAMQAFSPGSSNYDLSISYLDLVSSTDGVNFSSGIPAVAAGIDMNNPANAGQDSLVVFPAGSGTGTGTNLDLNRGAWQGLNAIDIDPSDAMEDGVQNNGNFEEAELVYASGISFTISRTDGQDFEATEEFVFSGNGNQWNDTEAASANAVIPEPSVAILVTLAGLSLVRRQRR